MDRTKLIFLAVDAAHMLGIVELPDVALEWNEKAITLAEASKADDARKWLGSLYNNTGWTYHDGKALAKALVMFERALAWHSHGVKQQGADVDESKAVRVARWSVARCHRSLGHFDEALATQLELEVLQEKHGGEDGYIYEEIAELLLEKGKEDEATSYYLKAYNILSKDKWLVTSEPVRIARLMRLAGQ